MGGATRNLSVDVRGGAFFYPDFDQFKADRCAEVILPDGRLNEACEPLVHQILELANTASFEVLGDWVGLDVRAVEAITESRDERPFNTLETLRARPYLGAHGLRKMYTYLYIDGRCPVENDHLSARWLLLPFGDPLANLETDGRDEWSIEST